jgi:hypothetical protein
MADDKLTKIELFLEKIISRKFFALVLSTVIFCLKMIDPSMWMAIVLSYMGVEGFSDMAVKWQNSKNQGSSNSDTTNQTAGSIVNMVEKASEKEDGPVVK